MEPESPFGGITVVLMGDFYQLPHVAEPYNLYSVTMKLLVDRKKLKMVTLIKELEELFFLANLKNLSFHNR